MKNRISITDVDLKYRISEVGKYNKAITHCFRCDKRVNTHENCIGFFENDWGVMNAVECPFCFEKYYFHAMKDDLMFFKASLDFNTNIHYH